MPATPELYRITLPDGTTYNFKDKGARDAIANLKNVEPVRSRDAATTPYGVTWKDNGVTITGTLVATEELQKFIYFVPASNSEKDNFDEYIVLKDEETDPETYFWEKMGSTQISIGDLGDLAYKDVASGTYQPEGTVSQPTFSGNELTSTGSVTASGTVSAPSFVGSQGSVSVSGTPSGSINIGTGTANYTPGGTVSAPTITVTESKETAYVADSATGGGSVTPGAAASCTLPSLNMSVVNETLVMNWTAGSFTANTPTNVTLPSFSSKQVMTGATASSSQPTFSGTGVDLEFTGATMNSTGNFTPEGTVSQPSFTGSEVSISVTGTPSGTVSQPTFSGTSKSVTVS